MPTSTTDKLLQAAAVIATSPDLPAQWGPEQIAKYSVRLVYELQRQINMVQYAQKDEGEQHDNKVQASMSGDTRATTS